MVRAPIFAALGARSPPALDPRAEPLFRMLGVADILLPLARRLRRRAKMGRMKLNPRLSRPAVELVKRFETFEPIARPAAHGGWIIGYGHTLTAREGAVVSRED